ncbi:hypothetical protein PC128_g26650, partial [Phytophthora cactorum]
MGLHNFKTIGSFDVRGECRSKIAMRSVR